MRKFPDAKIFRSTVCSVNGLSKCNLSHHPPCKLGSPENSVFVLLYCRTSFTSMNSFPAELRELPNNWREQVECQSNALVGTTNLAPPNGCFYTLCLTAELHLKLNTVTFNKKTYRFIAQSLECNH